MARLIIAIGLIALVVGIGSAGYGVWTIWQQHHMITSARPVKAKVLEHETKDLKGGGFVAKVPLVKYEYSVEGRAYTADKVTPAELMLPNTWAESVFSQFPVGAEVEALHAPHDPSQAFLIPKYSIYAYLPLLIGLAIAGIGLGILGDQMTTREEPNQAPAAGPMTLVPKQHHLARARLLGAIGILGLILGAPAILHHLMKSTAPHERMGFLMEGGYAIAVLVLLVLSAMSFRQGSGFGTPTVTLDRPPTIGQPVQIRVSQPTRFNGIAHLNGCLKCEAKDVRIFNTSEEKPDVALVEQPIPLASSRTATPEAEITGTAEVTIPANAPPSTPVDSPEPTHIVWTLFLTAEDSTGRKAETEYIVQVAGEPARASGSLS